MQKTAFWLFVCVIFTDLMWMQRLLPFLPEGNGPLPSSPTLPVPSSGPVVFHVLHSSERSICLQLFKMNISLIAIHLSGLSCSDHVFKTLL